MTHHHHPHNTPELPVKAIELIIAANQREKEQKHGHHVGQPTNELAHEKVHSDMNNLRSGFVPPDQMRREIAEIRSTMQQAGGVVPAGLDARMTALSTSNDINLKTAQSILNGANSPTLPA